jgi:membrane peptidoglycan carboxypeptidase
MGITTLTDTKNYGLSLVLGGGAVNLLELTSAYGVFATDGNYIPAISILKITDADGNVIEESKEQPTKVLDTQVARQINGILSDNNNRAPVFGWNNPLHFDSYQVAAKTGTTQNFIDGWTMGYSPFAVVGVWVGNSDNSPTKDAGVGSAAPIWNKVMGKILSSHPAENFTPPAPATNRSPVLLGQLPPNDTHTILYYVNKNDPMGGPPANPSDDPQYFMWQTAINNWLTTSGQPMMIPQAPNPENNQNNINQ